MLLRAVEEAGFAAHEVVVDRKQGVLLQKDGARAVVPYVDNFGVMALDQQTAWDGAERIREVLEQKGSGCTRPRRARTA